MGETVTPSDGPVAVSARRAAERLAQGNNHNLRAEVEALLHRDGAAPPDQYFEPISLASLIVSAAGFTWTVYQDLKTKTDHPSFEVIARRVRVELTDHTAIEPRERDHVIDIVVTETITGDDEL